MIVDSSALVEIALNDPEADRLVPVLLADASPRISAANLLETWMVIDRRGIPEAGPLLDDTIRQAVLIVEPVTESQVAIARDAWRRYGRGSGHPARLNYGDCFAYALARERDEPLLFVGNDFSRTDIMPALDAEAGSSCHPKPARSLSLASAWQMPAISSPTRPGAVSRQLLAAYQTDRS